MTSNKCLNRMVFIVLIQTTLIVVVQILSREDLKHVSDCDSTDAPNSLPLQQSNNKPITCSQFISQRIQQSEHIREKFLEKRQKILIGDRNIEKIRLYEARDKSTVVWNYYPPTFTCPHLMERVGTPADGGKWMCGIELFKNDYNYNDGDECIVYSFGVARQSSFEQEILARTNCKIYGFDPTVEYFNFENAPRELEHKIRTNAHFQPIGLGDSNVSGAKVFKTLKQIMDENNHTWIDFLKIDIEGSEFQSIQKISTDFKNGFPFGHFNLEVHLRGLNTMSSFNKLWTSLENGGLRAFFWEINLNPCLYGKKPALMEYSFVNVLDDRNKLLTTCNNS